VPNGANNSSANLKTSSHSSPKNEDFVRRKTAGQKTKLAKSRRNMLERLNESKPFRSKNRWRPNLVFERAGLRS